MELICSAVFHLPNELTLTACSKHTGQHSNRQPHHTCARLLGAKQHQSTRALGWRNLQARLLHGEGTAGPPTAEAFTCLISEPSPRKGTGTSVTPPGLHSTTSCQHYYRLCLPPSLPTTPRTLSPPLSPSLPTTPLTLCADDDAEAAHSLRADMVTSLQQMRMTGTAICAWVMGTGGSVHSSISTVVTMTLSATGSRKAPKVVAISNYTWCVQVGTCGMSFW